MKLWSSLEDTGTNSCKSTANKNVFKKELKSYFLEKLSGNYQTVYPLTVSSLPSMKQVKDN